MSRRTRPRRSPVARWISSARASWSGVMSASARRRAPSWRRRRPAPSAGAWRPGSESAMESLHSHPTTWGQRTRIPSHAPCGASDIHWGRREVLLLDEDDAQELVDGGHAFQYLEDTII